MTKKPSVKNKEWEKIRRDRLNKAFDDLAKLLPGHDEKVALSKIDVLQQAVDYINELHQRNKGSHDCATSDPSSDIVSDYKKIVSALRTQNGQLVEILQSAKIPIPQYTSEENTIDPVPENDYNKINVTPSNKASLPSYKCGLANKQPKAVQKKRRKSQEKIPAKKKQHFQNKISTAESNLTEETTKPQNPKEGTTVTSNHTATVTHTSITTPIVTTSIFDSTITTNVVPVPSTSDQYIQENKKPQNSLTNTGVKRSNTSITHSKDVIPPSKKVKKANPFETAPANLQALSTQDQKYPSIPEEIPTDCLSNSKTSTLLASSMNETNNSVETSMKDIRNELTLDSPRSELPNDLFASLQQGGGNEESLSPTAAFLLTFPVVSSASGKVPENSVTEESGNSILNVNLSSYLFPPSSGKIQPALKPSFDFIDNTFDKKDSSKDMVIEKHYSGSNIKPRQDLYDQSKSHFTTIKNYPPVSNQNEQIMFSGAISSNTESAKGLFDFKSSPAVRMPNNLYNPMSLDFSQSNSAISSSMIPFGSDRDNSGDFARGLYQNPTPFTFSLTNPTTSNAKNIQTSGCYASSNFSIANNAGNFTAPHLNSSTETAPSIFSSSYNPFGVDSGSLTSDPSMKMNTNFTFTLTPLQKEANDNSFKSCNPFSIDSTLSNTRHEQDNFSKAKHKANGYGHVNYLAKMNNNFNEAPREKEKVSKLSTEARSSGQSNRYNVNWMTTPDVRQAVVDFPPVIHVPPPTAAALDFPIITNCHPGNHQSQDDNFPWSPSKMSSFLEQPTNQYMPSTLPTLHGDLALNAADGKSRGLSNSRLQHTELDDGFNATSSVSMNAPPLHFLSVSQLVETEKEGSSMRMTKARQKTARYDESKRTSVPENRQYNDCAGGNIFLESFGASLSSDVHKASSNSYTAESLIGPKRQNHLSDGADQNNLLDIQTESNYLSDQSYTNPSNYFPPNHMNDTDYMSYGVPAQDAFGSNKTSPTNRHANIFGGHSKPPPPVVGALPAQRSKKSSYKVAEMFSTGFSDSQNTSSTFFPVTSLGISSPKLSADDSSYLPFHHHHHHHPHHPHLNFPLKRINTHNSQISPHNNTVTSTSGNNSLANFNLSSILSDNLYGNK